MKISFRTHPILGNLFQGTLKTEDGFLAHDCDFDYLKSPEATDFFEEWIKSSDEFKNEINCVCEKFLVAMTDSINKISLIINESLQSPSFDPCDPKNVVKGTYILDKMVLNLSFKQKQGVISLTLYVFESGAIPIGFLKIEEGSPVNFWLSKSTNLQAIDLFSIPFAIWGLAIFKKHADVDTIIVPPFKRNKTNGIKRVNDTKLPIYYLDSRWFNTIVRDEDFDVKGHFRLQACGKAFSERKRIWIDNFIKHGYTIHARKQVA